MRISDWSSDVCSSDLSTLTSRQRRSKARFAAPAPLLRPQGTFSVEREKGVLRVSAPIRLIGATLPPPPILDPTPPPGASLTRTPPRPDSAEDALRRELYLFALYRTLEAALLALMVFSPFGGLIGEPRDPFLAMAVAIAYLPMSLALLLATRRDHSALAWQACLGVGVDIVVAALITHAIPGAAPGVALMLLFNVGAAALLVPLPLAMSVAAAAASAVVGEYLWNTLDGTPAERPFAEVLMFSVSFFAMATVSNLLGRQMRQSHAVASLRTAEAANLSEVNGLNIRRMTPGLLRIHLSGFVRPANEAAMLLL